ncbi:MAG: hypothetical protein HW389_3534 [Bacteroidetes bacterium]|nr:hypothetical protein [Bacteroidota bacterium]
MLLLAILIRRIDQRGYLCHYAIDYCQIQDWLRQNLGGITTREEAKHARRFLALKMAETLVHGIGPRPDHRRFTEEGGHDSEEPLQFIQSRLRAFVDNDERSGAGRDDLNFPHPS